MLEWDGVLICVEKYLEPLSVCFSDASQTLRSECDVTPELLKQTLSMRKHKHLHSGCNGERMCRCVRMRSSVETGEVEGQILCLRREYQKSDMMVMVT